MSNIKSIIRLAEYPFEENARYVKIDNNIYMTEQDLDNYLNLVGLNKNELISETSINIVKEEVNELKNDIAYSILYELKVTELENIDAVKYANRSLIVKLINALFNKKSTLKLDNRAKIDNFYNPMIKECDDVIDKIDKEIDRINKDETTPDLFSTTFVYRLNSSLIKTALSLLSKNFISSIVSGLIVINNTSMLIWSYSDYKSILNAYRNGIINAKKKLLKERAKNLELLNKR